MIESSLAALLDGDLALPRGGSWGGCVYDADRVVAALREAFR
jgi:hypothetical protein